jgi:hypothetical protein
VTRGPNTPLKGLFPGHSGPVAAPAAPVGGNAPPRPHGGPTAALTDELLIPLNTPQGQLLLGARDLIAGEAFGDK